MRASKFDPKRTNRNKKATQGMTADSAVTGSNGDLARAQDVNGITVRGQESKIKSWRRISIMAPAELEAAITWANTINLEIYYFWCRAITILIHAGFMMYEMGASRVKHTLAAGSKNVLAFAYMIPTFWMFGWWIYLASCRDSYSPGCSRLWVSCAPATGFRKSAWRWSSKPWPAPNISRRKTRRKASNPGVEDKASPGDRRGFFFA